MKITCRRLGAICVALSFAAPLSCAEPGAGRAPDRGEELVGRIATKLDETRRQEAAGEPVQWRAVMDPVLLFASTYPQGAGQVAQGLYGFLGSFERWGVPEAEESRFIESLIAARNGDLREIARSRKEILSLRHSPLVLRLTGLNGETIDLSCLRGKVMLIDFWASWCGTCLRAMSNIRTVYEKYHDQGFEVVGLAVETPENRAKVEAVLERLKIPWPQSLIGDGDRKAPFAKRLGIRRLPVTLLLDKSGRLVTTDIDHGRGARLDTEVRRLLVLPPHPPGP